MIKILLVVLGIIASTLAQIMLKKSGQFGFLKDFNFFKFFILGGFFYVISFGLYAYLLKIFDLSKISPIMTVGTMLFVIVAGMMFFRETISLRQGLGVLLGIIAIFLIAK